MEYKIGDTFGIDKYYEACQFCNAWNEEQTEEIVAEIESLKAERSAKIQEIKERFPYYEQESEERFADDSNTIEDTEE